MVLIAPARPFVTDPTTAGLRGTPTSAWRPPRRAAVWSWAIAALVAGVAGCNRGPSIHDLTLGSADLSQPERDYLEVAIDFLKQRDEHNLERSAGQTNYYLNRWIRGETADPQWTIDRPLLNTLPDAIRRAPATKELLSDRALTGLEFRMDDVVFLEEARWLQAIAQWVSRQPLPQDLSDWIDRRGLSNRAARRLAQCALLFDWTVRNIQLDELLPYPKQATAGPQPSGRGPDPKIDWPPPMHGVPGPGYTLDPWHVLLYGHGDMYQRARIFILLARQLRIHVVMLAIDTRTGRAQPWLPAAVLDGELFLFDAELGLPIPGPGGQGIATLCEVLDTPSLLESLDVGDRYRYRVRGDNLDQVVALIDAAPEYLSQRMTLLEQELEAADQMILSVAPSEIKQEVESCRGIKAVRLWAVPVETIMYRQARAEIIARNPELQWQEFVERGVFLGLTPLVKGRRHYLLGNHAKQGDEVGATGYLLQSRLPQSQIEALETSRDAQAAVGLRKTPGMSEAEWQGRLQQLQRLQFDSKEHASYWLGIMHMEQGDHAVAVNWLKHRTLETNPEGRWQFGARYNLARCYEALGQTDDARQLYLTDQSPQRHGNLVRARRLDRTADTTR
jgi:tetratricopeptide (TPR) repeat protein